MLEEVPEEEMLLEISPEEEALDNNIQKIINNMNQLSQILTDEEQVNLMLKVDTQWLASRSSQYFLHRSQAGVLYDRIRELQFQQEQLKRQKSHIELDHYAQKLELAKQSNPKLYFLRKKLLSFQEQHQQLQEYFEDIERQRNTLSQEYQKLTKKLKLEEKIKIQIKKHEKIVAEREEELQVIKDAHNELRTNLEELQTEAEQKESINEQLEAHQEVLDQIQGVKDIVAGLNRKIAYLDQQLQQARSGAHQTGYITKSTKNPSQLIRVQIRKLEKEISQRSLQIKQNQKEKQDLMISIEQDKRILQELQKQEKLKPIIKPIAFLLTQGLKQYGIEAPSIKNASPVRFSIKSMIPPTENSLKLKDTSRSVVSARKKKPSEEELKKLKLVEDVQTSLNTGEPARLLTDLRGFGKPTQGLASKLIEMNRGQFKAN